MDPEIFEGGEAEIDLFTTYIYQMMIGNKSSELCLSRIMTPFVYTHKALEDYLPNQLGHIPMAFMYGEHDWVNRSTGERLLANGCQGEIFQTADSGHHLYVEAAEECVACIIKFHSGQEEALKFIESVA